MAVDFNIKVASELRIEGFRKWLMAQGSPGAWVGQGCSIHLCPLVKYLRHVTGLQCTVTQEAVRCGMIVDLPANGTWVEGFLQLIDAYDPKGAGITAIACVDLLDQVDSECLPD